MNEFYPLRSRDMEARIKHIEETLTSFGRSVTNQAVEDQAAAFAGSTTTTTSGTGSFLGGDVNGPVFANEVDALRGKSLTGTETAFFVYQYDGTDWVARLLRVPVVSTAISYAALATDYLILANVSGGGLTVTLPTAVGVTGRLFEVKKTDSSANLVTIATTGGQTIDGSASAAIGMPQTALLCCSDGTNWEII